MNNKIDAFQVNVGPNLKSNLILFCFEANPRTKSNWAQRFECEHVPEKLA